ncbi:MAG: hypothetical protein ACYTEQ_05830 [Planctomycetota bacterium]
MLTNPHCRGLPELTGLGPEDLGQHGVLNAAYLQEHYHKRQHRQIVREALWLRFYKTFGPIYS